MSSEVSRFLIGGIALFILLSPFIVPGGPGQQIYLNGERVRGLEVWSTEGKLRVPLQEAVRLLGGKLKRESSGVSSVKWGSGEGFYLTSFDMTEREGREYVELVYLARKMGADVRRMSGDVYLNTDRATLLNSEIDGREISLTFSRLAPFTVDRSGKTLEVHFYNVEPVDKSLSTGGLGYIESARLSPAGENELIVRLELSDSLDYRSDRSFSEGGKYRFDLSVTLAPPAPSEKTYSGLQAGELVYKKYSRYLNGSTHSVHSLKIPNWRDNYSLRVAVAHGDIGERSSLRSLMERESGVAAINGNFFDPATGIPIGLLIRNGDLLSDNWGRRGVLAVDYFGELGFLRPEAGLYLRSEGGEIEVTDINRPAGSNDLIAFTGSYSGEFCSREGIPKTVLVLEEGKVVSKLETRHYLPDYFDLLVIATGRKRGLLGSLSEGENVQFKWRTNPSLSSAKSALSAGPILIEEGRNGLNLKKEDFDYGSSLVSSSAARSVVATTRSGDLLFLLVRNSGISLTALPELLLSAPLNIRNALALDGGSSAEFVYRSPRGIRQVGGDRRIPVGLVVVPKS